MELARGPWADRVAAGRDLANVVQQVVAGNKPPVVLGLPRGGVVVAAEVADAINGELDVLVVRKAGVPWHRELALGAVTASGVRVRNAEVIRHVQLDEQDIEAAFTSAEREAREREHHLREGRPAANVGGRTVLVVDDGIATGATAEAAVQLLRNAQPPPARVILAVPVAPPDTIERLASYVDDVVVLRQPAGFAAVGEWFQSFEQVSDDQVRQLMALRT